MQKILISACLLGEPVRYDGRSKPLRSPLLQQWHEEGRLISFCPEIVGGLPTPRIAAEIIGGEGKDVLEQRAQVIDRSGTDVTDAFLLGAQQALETCRQNDIKIAILTAHSPSCGDRQIYDGSFSATLKNGSGVTASLLHQHGIRIFNQTSISQIPQWLGD